MGLVVLRAGARRARSLLLVGVAFAALPAGPALANTTIGHTGGSNLCTTIGPGAVYGDSGYVVPSGGGRITSFSFQSDSSNAGWQLDLLVLRPEGSKYRVVGRTGVVRLTGTGLETFAANIPVAAGDILGFWFPARLDNCYRAGTGPIIARIPASDPAAGDLVVMQSNGAADLNESANLVGSGVARRPPRPHFLKVTPSRTNAGKTITVFGSVDHGCQTGHKGATATIYSNAFEGATKRSFAGVPAVYVWLSKSKTGAFSFKLKLSKKLKTGTYAVRGRCGGGNFGSAKLNVVKARSF